MEQTNGLVGSGSLMSSEASILISDLVDELEPVDAQAAEAAAQHHLQLTKPPGSLGRIETLGTQLCAIAGAALPPVPTPAAVAIFAADHGAVSYTHLTLPTTPYV